MKLIRWVAVAALLFTTSCGTATTAEEKTSEAPAAKTQLTVTDPWVKAAKKGEMTAAFAKLSNPSDKAITITKAASDVSMMMELHEVVMKDGEMKMQPKEGGFVAEPGKDLVLEPGGLHIMFMGLSKDLRPGDQVKVTLTFADGGTQEITALVKKFTGGNEKYDNGKKKKKKMKM